MSPIPNIPILSKKSRALFDAKIVKTSGCWEWVGCKLPKGYGQFGIGATPRLAHRIAYFLATGIQPGKMIVCHKCDNPGCVRPSHLFLGTTKDNNTDAKNKGRTARGDGHGSKTNPKSIVTGKKHGRYTKPECTPRGVNHWRSKLSERDIVLIHSMAGISHIERAEAFGVSRQTIGEILSGKTWAHLHPDKERIEKNRAQLALA